MVVDDGGKTVVVGVRLDALSRELLTWALVKIADTGDRVVALHVLPNSSDFDSDSLGSPSSVIALVNAFDSVLAAYDGFCNLKQVELKLKVCRGSSLRKALVREAIEFGASSLILGVNGSGQRIGSSPISIAKYCARKLPHDCAVVAVGNGKIVFRKEAFQPADNQCFLARGGSRTEKTPRLRKGSESCPNSPAGTKQYKLPSPLAPLLARNCSVCWPIHRAQVAADEASSSGSMEGETESSYAPSSPATTIPYSRSLPGSPTPSNPDVQTAWPDLRKMVLKKKHSLTEKTRNSVLLWAMRVPSRNTPALAAIHPDQKLSMADKEYDNQSRISVSPASRPSGDKKDLLNLSKELGCISEKFSSKCRVFTYEELSDATSEFADENLIGKGGNSYVYKGCFADGRVSAVKILKHPESVVKEFIVEIEIITALHHKNVTPLLGFCFDSSNLLLVYDFLTRGSLDVNLQDDKKNELGWKERYKVALGVADALNYLHIGGDNEQPVIHRDVKSSNILLSDDFEPQLSDFGLATWALSSSSLMACGDVAGTFGYLAPEYFAIGKVNEKIDVYAYGVVLLELLTGRKPIARGSPRGQENLVLWAKPILQSGNAKELLDPNLANDLDDDQVERMILAASLCTRRAPKLRPKMSFVFKLLQGDDSTVKSARIQLRTSEELVGLDEENAYPVINDIQSHMSLALLDIEDDTLSTSSSS